MSKKLLILTKYSKIGPSSNFRLLIYENILKEHFETEISYFWPDIYYEKYSNSKKKYLIMILFLYIKCFLIRYRKLKKLKNYDIVIIQKELFPGLPFCFIRKLNGANIIMDIDDAIYLNKNDVSDKIAKIAKKIIVGNNKLLNHYNTISNNCIVLPTVDYTPSYVPYRKDSYENKIIGWIGTKSSINNLDIVVDALNIFLGKNPDYSFVYICSDSFDYDKKIINSKFVKWQLDTYIREMSNFSIGIMPLIDNEFNEGKCGFKLIQYLNLHIPVISSPVGVNNDICSKYGILAADNEWLDAFDNIFNKNNYLKYKDFISMNFETEYGFNHNAKKLINIIDNVE